MRTNRTIEPARAGRLTVKWNKMTVAGVVLFLLTVALTATAVFAQTTSTVVQPDDEITVNCDGRGIEIDRESERKLRLICQPDTTAPEPTPQPPQPTPQPPEPQPPVAEGAYYVSPQGDDRSDGSRNAPFRTIQHAVDQAQAGDVVYVRGGVYVEEVSIRNSGTTARPITVMAYPGEKPVIDGRYQLPEPPNSGWARCNDTVSPPICMHYKPMVSIEGDHIVFEGFGVANSNGRGIRVWRNDGRPQHIVVRNNEVYENRNAAILVLSGDHILIEGNKVWHNANYATHDRSPSVLNWPHAVNTNHSTDIVIRGNTVYENWGEGIGAGRGSVGVVIEDNVIYDNKIQIYVHRVQNTVVQRNLTYCTNRPEYNRGGDPPPGIVVNNEHNFADDITVQNARIVNNIMAGCRVNFGIWGGGGNVKIGSEDVLFAHNTLVNATNNPNDGDVAIGINISEAPHRGVVIQNNIIRQMNGRIITVGGGAEVRFANNLWSQTPPAAATGPGDVVAEPLLANGNAPLVPGAVSGDWFMLQAGSDAVNQAAPIGSVTTDFFGNPRDAAADIGAHELMAR